MYFYLFKMKLKSWKFHRLTFYLSWMWFSGLLDLSIRKAVWLRSRLMRCARLWEKRSNSIVNCEKLYRKTCDLNVLMNRFPPPLSVIQWIFKIDFLFTQQPIQQSSAQTRSFRKYIRHSKSHKLKLLPVNCLLTSW